MWLRVVTPVWAVVILMVLTIALAFADELPRRNLQAPGEPVVGRVRVMPHRLVVIEELHRLRQQYGASQNSSEKADILAAMKAHAGSMNPDDVPDDMRQFLADH